MTNIPETDLVKIAEREVIEAAKAFTEKYSKWIERSGLDDEMFDSAGDLLAAVSLLESREAADIRKEER
jgi:hypothetical protein